MNIKLNRQVESSKTVKSSSAWIECVFLSSEYLYNQVGKILRDSLEAVGAKAMVVGHTPQLSGVNWYIYLNPFPTYHKSIKSYKL